MILQDYAITTHSAEGTQNFGEEFSKKIRHGDIIALYGDLGSGKTQLVKGICRGLGVTQVVNSPTFIIVNEYSSDRFDKIFHFDLYRMKTQNEILDIGFKDYLNNGSVIFIEWPEHIENLLPQSTIKIHIAHTVEDENSRWIKLENV